MRIGMLADTYKPHVSGVTTHIALNKKVFEQLGHEVYVFTFGDLEYQDDEKNVIRSQGIPLVDTGFYLSFRYSTEAQKILRTMDIVHVHHPFLSGRMAIRYCYPRRIPLIFTNHTRYDLYTQVYLPVLPDVVGDAFLSAYLSAFSKAIDLVIAPSAGLQKILKELGVESNVEIIPNGVDLMPFRNPVQPVQRESLGFAPENVVLIYTGRLGPEKNLHFLLRSFAGIARVYKQARLLIVGDGPERDDLEDRVHTLGISDRVCFTGMVPYAELPRYISLADAFASASVSEVHPLTVIEAMATGLPVLGIQSPGVGDIVQDGVTGLLATEEDLAQFTALMGRIVTQTEERKRMGVAARAASQEYSIERTSRLLLKRYEELVVQGARRKGTLRNRLNLLLERILA